MKKGDNNMSDVTQTIKNSLNVACAVSVFVFCVSSLANIAIDAGSFIVLSLKSEEK